MKHRSTRGSSGSAGKVKHTIRLRHVGRLSPPVVAAAFAPRPVTLGDVAASPRVTLGSPFWRLLHRWLLVPVVFSFFVLACDVADPGPPPPVPPGVSINFGPGGAVNWQAFSFELGVEAPAGAAVTVTGPGADTSFTVPESEQLAASWPGFFDEARPGLPTSKAYEVRVEHAEFDEPAVRPHTLTVGHNPDYLPELTLDLPSGALLTGEPYDFHLTVRDTLLTEAVLTLGGQPYTFAASDGEVAETVTHTFTQSGATEVKLESMSGDGYSDALSEEVHVTGVFAVDVQSLDFLHREMVNPHSAIRFINEELEIDEVVFADPNGRIQAELPEGKYRIASIGDRDGLGRSSDLCRVEIFDYNLTADSQQIKDWDHGFAPNGYEHTLVGEFIFDRDFASEMHCVMEGGYISDTGETLTGEELLENLSRQTGGLYITSPETKNTQTIVFNKGNPDYPSDWRVYGLDQMCNTGGPGTLPPGVMIEETGAQWNVDIEANFDAYISELFDVWNDPRVGGNPYKIEIVKGYADEINHYVNAVSRQHVSGRDFCLTTSVNDVMFVGHTGGAQD